MQKTIARDIFSYNCQNQNAKCFIMICTTAKLVFYIFIVIYTQGNGDNFQGPLYGLQCEQSCSNVSGLIIQVSTRAGGTIYPSTLVKPQTNDGIYEQLPYVYCHKGSCCQQGELKYKEFYGTTLIVFFFKY